MSAAETKYRYFCLSQQPAAPHRACNLIFGHAGDHAFMVDYPAGPSVVASWPGVNSKYQTGPDRQVTL